jgi:hypothetical protein
VLITESSDGRKLHGGCQIIAAVGDAGMSMERLDGEDRMLICAHRCAPPHVGVRWGTANGRGWREGRPRPDLLGRHLDVVTLQAAVELKPREAQERGGARLVPMGTLERVDDGPALELIQRRGGRRPHRFG